MARARTEMRRKKRQKRFVCATCGASVLRANAERWTGVGPRHRGGVQPHFCSGRCIDALQVLAGLEAGEQRKETLEKLSLNKLGFPKFKTVEIYHPRGGRTTVLAASIAFPTGNYVRKRYDTEAREWKPVPPEPDSMPASSAEPG